MENITFQELNLPSSLFQSLKDLNFINPTPIQAKAIPVALEGKDIIGSAKTGTGKTGAFGIPLIARLLTNSQDRALVMTPTRELAVQVRDLLRGLVGKQAIKSALLIGGDSMSKQLQDLRHQPRLIIGTPGRINDHLQRGSLKLNATTFLVLDETDRMLDMGFSIQIDQIVKHLPKKRQTLLFSATLPHHILDLSKRYLIDPVQVSVDTVDTPSAAIQQDVAFMSEDEKFSKLVEECQQRDGSIIVFVRTKFGADKLANSLCDQDVSARAIHGNLRQRSRDQVIQSFRQQRYRVLVATDIAARGLDIAHVRHVINFDLPQSPEDYIHRVGRTGRAGASGFALNFVAPRENRLWRHLNRSLRIAPEVKEKMSFKQGPKRHDYAGAPKRSEYTEGSKRGDYANARPKRNDYAGAPKGSDYGNAPKRRDYANGPKRHDHGSNEGRFERRFSNNMKPSFRRNGSRPASQAKMD